MVSELSRYRREVNHVFDLLGRREPDLTAALGWTLAQSSSLMAALLRHLDIDAGPDEFTVALEESDDQGRTDIELTGPAIKVIIEAKQGWLVPDDQQFSLYAPRFEGFERTLFVSLSDSSQKWADGLLQPINGVPVVHVAWDTVREALKTSIKKVRGREQFWLQQLEGYMGQATSRRPLDDQWVFCVVASNAYFGGNTFKDWVRKERVYFPSLRRPQHLAQTASQLHMLPVGRSGPAGQPSQTLRGSHTARRAVAEHGRIRQRNCAQPTGGGPSHHL